MMKNQRVDVQESKIEYENWIDGELVESGWCEETSHTVVIVEDLDRPEREGMSLFTGTRKECEAYCEGINDAKV